MSAPMLLQRYDVGHVIFPVLVERKVDGLRCLIRVADGAACAYSRVGNVIHAAQPLADRLADVWPDGVYDGELAADTWESTMSQVRSKRVESLMFHVFDVLTVEEWNYGGSAAALLTRKRRLLSLPEVPGAVVVPWQMIDATDGLMEAFHAVVDAGGEGVVVKVPDSPYLCGSRTWHWQKLKAGAVEEW